LRKGRIYIVYILIVLGVMLLAIGPVAARAESINASVQASDVLTLKVMTLNIHSGINWYGQYDLDAIAKYIEEVQPDLVGMQEVDQNWSSMSQFTDIPGELARRLNMYYAFSASLERNNGNFGNLILSRYPISSIWTELMPGSLERRSFAMVQVLINGARVNFLTTHLGLSTTDRQQQTASIMQFISQVNGPLIITGDFNGEANDPGVTAFGTNFLDLQSLSDDKEHGSFRIKNGSIVPRMDYIFASPDFQLGGFQVTDNYISDHLPMVAELKLPLSNQAVSGEPVFQQTSF
jgi:endonuclease/exonuclease/phosphatase family metal-dependent hydrolase